MKNRYVFFICLFIATTSLFAQKKLPPIKLKAGEFSKGKNLLKSNASKDSWSTAKFHNKIYSVIQFDKTPTVFDRKKLTDQGIHLYGYMTGNAFMAELPESFSQDALGNSSIAGVYHIDRKYKISPNVSESISSYAADPKHAIAVSFFGSLKKEDVSRELSSLGANILTTKIQPNQVVFIKASTDVLDKIAALPFVSYINAQVLKDEPLNYYDHGFHSLDALAAFSGRNLQGKNVTIGIGDDADPSSHIDFTGRLILRTPNPVNYHGTHTVGTAGGGGILNPKYKGMAPKATLVSQSFSDILVNAPVYMNDFGMVLTNNSYYTGANGCVGDGEYDVLSNYIDGQVVQSDSLLHVFAAGNDGGLTCSTYPHAFNTIKSGFQSAKDVLTVGNVDYYYYVVTPLSSHGPVNDGRLKPEIMGAGSFIQSTYPYNTYGYSSGTSMSSPAVTGTMALLYERYRQLHGGISPSSALIKAVACNGADDMGNVGPDFTYGFGRLNARTAVEAIESNHYFTGAVDNAGNNTHVINSVPAGMQQIKIMLYWNDMPAAPNAASALVNNLDLTVTEPNGTTTHYPLILNPAPSHVNDLAVEGVDAVNNIEQVVIYNPPAGNFTIHVNGTNVPMGPQNYVVAYEIISPSVTVEYPFGNETLVPGESEIIRWNAYGGEPNSFNINYSIDNGATWIPIANVVDPSARSITWTVPNTITNQALVQVVRNGVNYTDVSDYNFTILGQPTLTVTNPCQTYAQLAWNKIIGATSYEVMMLKGDSMQTIASTTDTTYLLQGQRLGSNQWLSVRAINGAVAGRRAIAANMVSASTTACSFINNDFTVDSLISPLTGRQYTSTQLGNAQAIKIELKNLGGLSSSVPIPVSYQVNGGAVVTENISSTIASGSIYDYTFSATYDFSGVGSYTIKTWVSYPTDTLHMNDTLTITIKNLQNDPILLSPTFTEGFENASIGTYYNGTLGFAGLDRCDFFSSSSNGRARTYINTGFARTGNRSAILDQQSASNNANADSLITTFNLSNYSPSDQIWLNYYYRNQGIDFSLPGNTVWIRGNDQATWIPVDTLVITAASIGNYLPSKNIDVKGVLASAVPAQTVTSSFQIKFGEQGFTSANSVITDGDLDDGYSFDDITFTKALNDVGIVGLISPNLNSTCNLTNAELIQVKVKNYSATLLNNISISYSINGKVVTENIPSLAGLDSLIYSFSQKADLSNYGNYNIAVWVHYNGDNYPNNDSLLNMSLNTVPIISSYPYLEGFESSNGYWYSGGTNNDWAWGAPQKTIIKNAANGKNAWVTDLNSNYNNNELAYLYSPCFDLSSLSQPVLSFSHIFQTEDDCDCDYHWVEYSLDGITWLKLGASGNGTNWYDNPYKQGWQKSDTIWHVSSVDIPTNGNKVRFRFVMFSDPYTNYEGVGIDDIHVFDKASVYNAANIGSGISQPVSGNGWVNFSVGKNVVAAINPNGQDLGNTVVKVYIEDSMVRNSSNQYYLGRNIVIQPSTQPTDSVSVRFYFLDSEVDSLMSALGCTNCGTLHDAYQLGVTQYSKDVVNEDSTLSNNTSGIYRFMVPHNQVSIIPNDNGYYAEFKVAGFSEFWINAGGTTQSQPIGSVLQSFTAIKTDSSHSLLQWSLISGSNTSYFLVQKSVDGGTDFSNIDSISYNPSSNNYQYADSLFYGNNYYRIKIVDSSGKYQYTNIQFLTRTEPITQIQVFPNPVLNNTALTIKTPENCQSIQLCDALGRVFITENTSGLSNTLELKNGVATGIYFLIIQTDKERKVVKVFVQ